MTDNVTELPYADRVRIAYWIKIAMDRHQSEHDRLRHMILTQPAFALENKHGGISGAISCAPASAVSVMDAAVLEDQKVKLLRLWISELHVLDRDVQEYKPE